MRPNASVVLSESNLPPSSGNINYEFSSCYDEDDARCGALATSEKVELALNDFIQMLPLSVKKQSVHKRITIMEDKMLRPLTWKTDCFWVLNTMWKKNEQTYDVKFGMLRAWK